MSREYCEVADEGCLNPPGWEDAGPRRTSVTCATCGVHCCARCRRAVAGQVLCAYCADPTPLLEKP